MRALDATLAERLAGGTTTLCRCWRITRRDGVALGFTDHDEAVTFAATEFRPVGGFVAADVARHGLAAGGLEVEGALSAEGLSADDLAGGLYDGARVEIYVVDWTTPAARVRVRVGTVGEIERAGGAFRAEVRGLAQSLDQVRGRVFSALCDADLGDGRCRVNLTGPALRALATVAAVETASVVRVTGLEAYAGGWFAHGRLVVAGGALAGWATEIKAHARGDGIRIETWRAPPAPFAPGDTAWLTAGCDKRFGTCRTKFDNAVNFQGFPHMPGNAFALSYPPHPSGDNDGGTIV